MMQCFVFARSMPHSALASLLSRDAMFDGVQSRASCQPQHLYHRGTSRGTDGCSVFEFTVRRDIFLVSIALESWGILLALIILADPDKVI